MHLLMRQHKTRVNELICYMLLETESRTYLIMLIKIKLTSENSLGKKSMVLFQTREEKAVCSPWSEIKHVNSPLIILRSQHTPNVNLSSTTIYFVK
jgi:hypothetical protein